MTTLTTPFLEHHKRAGAKLIEFAGFLMPVSYAGILAQHTAVRTAAGVFDGAETQVDDHLAHGQSASGVGPGPGWRFGHVSYAARTVPEQASMATVRT